MVTSGRISSSISGEMLHFHQLLYGGEWTVEIAEVDDPLGDDGPNRGSAIESSATVRY
jgi:hypothetical protein